MGKTKESCKYHGLSIPVPFMEQIKEHIGTRPQYRSVASFAKQAMINQMNYEKLMEQVKK